MATDNEGFEISPQGQYDKWVMEQAVDADTSTQAYARWCGEQ